MRVSPLPLLTLLFLAAPVLSSFHCKWPCQTQAACRASGVPVLDATCSSYTGGASGSDSVCCYQQTDCSDADSTSLCRAGGACRSGEEKVLEGRNPSACPSGSVCCKGARKTHREHGNRDQDNHAKEQNALQPSSSPEQPSSSPSQPSSSPSQPSSSPSQPQSQPSACAQAKRDKLIDLAAAEAQNDFSAGLLSPRVAHINQHVWLGVDHFTAEHKRPCDASKTTTVRGRSFPTDCLVKFDNRDCSSMQHDTSWTNWMAWNVEIGGDLNAKGTKWPVCVNGACSIYHVDWCTSAVIFIHQQWRTQHAASIPDMHAMTTIHTPFHGDLVSVGGMLSWFRYQETLGNTEVIALNNDCSRARKGDVFFQGGHVGFVEGCDPTGRVMILDGNNPQMGRRTVSASSIRHVARWTKC